MDDDDKFLERHPAYEDPPDDIPPEEESGGGMLTHGGSVSGEDPGLLSITSGPPEDPEDFLWIEDGHLYLGEVQLAASADLEKLEARVSMLESIIEEVIGGPMAFEKLLREKLRRGEGK